jgi:hypothetical protein
MKQERKPHPALEQFETYKRSILDDISDVAAQDTERTRLNAIKDRFEALAGHLSVGSRVTLKSGP